MGSSVGVGGLTTLAQKVLQGAIGLEVGEQFRLAGRGNDNDAVDVRGLKGLLDHVLDDGLIEDGEHLLGGALGAREEAGAETGGGNDSRHVVKYSFRRLAHS